MTITSTGSDRGARPDYAALVEAAGDFIYTLDLEGRFTYLNRAAGRLMGRPVEDMLGRKFTSVLTPQSCEVALRNFDRGLAGAEATPLLEVELLRSDGSTVLLEVLAGSLHLDDKLIGRQGIGRDIGALRSLQEAVARKSSQALRQLHEAVSRATADKHGLTTFDLSVLRLLAQGASNREIASALHRSPHTIKDHIKKIKARVGATRRAELVTTALKLGLTTQAGIQL
jgi:PAS domain S-box-containing protein